MQQLKKPHSYQLQGEYLLPKLSHNNKRGMVIITYSLNRKLFQLADADWEKFKQLPEIDQERFWLILHILHTDDLEDIEMTQSFASALFRARLKKEMEEKSKKKNQKRAAVKTKKQQLTA